MEDLRQGPIRKKRGRPKKLTPTFTPLAPVSINTEGSTPKKRGRPIKLIPTSTYNNIYNAQNSPPEPSAGTYVSKNISIDSAVKGHISSSQINRSPLSDITNKEYVSRQTKSVNEPVKRISSIHNNRTQVYPTQGFNFASSQNNLSVLTDINPTNCDKQESEFPQFSRRNFC